MRKWTLLLFLPLLLSCKNYDTKIVKSYEINKKGFEPSGVTFLNDTFYIISDDGRIALIHNKRIKYKKIEKGKDFEGITNDGKNLYAVIEGEDSIVKLGKKYKIKQKYKINRKFNSKTVLDKRGDGLEAVTFLYEDEKGKHFIVANQSNKTKGKDKSALLFIVIKGKKAVTYRYLPMKILDISGLYYDQKNDLLYLLSDNDDLIYIYQLSKFKLLNKIAIQGEGQEGIALLKDRIFISDDSGKFFELRYKKK